MKIVDSIMFFDENMLLDLRLNILNKYVSKFIICESTYNHNGEKKKLNFDIKNFSKFRSKIDYIILDKQPDNLRSIDQNDSSDLKESKILDNALLRENFQRNFAYNNLMSLSDDDLILINDLDEIPNLENFIYKKKITVFKQVMLYFKLNLIYPDISWSGSKICKKKDLINPQWLRNVKTKKYPIWRLDILFSKKRYNDIQVIEKGGWHFTNIKTPEEIHYKYKSYCHHREYELSGMNVESIKEIIKSKHTIYDLKVDQRTNKIGKGMKLINLKDHELPDYIVNKKNKLTEWFD